MALTHIVLGRIQIMRQLSCHYPQQHGQALVGLFSIWRVDTLVLLLLSWSVASISNWGNGVRSVAPKMECGLGRD